MFSQPLTAEVAWYVLERPGRATSYARHPSKVADRMTSTSTSSVPTRSVHSTPAIHGLSTLLLARDPCTGRLRSELASPLASPSRHSPSMTRSTIAAQPWLSLPWINSLDSHSNLGRHLC